MSNETKLVTHIRLTSTQLPRPDAQTPPRLMAVGDVWVIGVDVDGDVASHMIGRGAAEPWEPNPPVLQPAPDA